MRRIAAVAAVLVGVVAVGPVLANGIGGDSPPTRIPVPARDFSAIVEDVSGTRIALSRFTFNGEVFLYGDLGAGQASVPFEKIVEIRFGAVPGDADHFVATATTREGEQIALTLEHDVLWYGQAAFGYYQIATGKLLRVEFPAPPQ